MEPASFRTSLVLPTICFAVIVAYGYLVMNQTSRDDLEEAVPGGLPPA
jgi:hypothetical protein